MVRYDARVCSVPCYGLSWMEHFRSMRGGSKMASLALK